MASEDTLALRIAVQDDDADAEQLEALTLSLLRLLLELGSGLNPLIFIFFGYIVQSL